MNAAIHAHAAEARLSLTAPSLLASTQHEASSPKRGLEIGFDNSLARSAAQLPIRAVAECLAALIRRLAGKLIWTFARFVGSRLRSDILIDLVDLVLAEVIEAGHSLGHQRTVMQQLRKSLAIERYR